MTIYIYVTGPGYPKSHYGAYRSWAAALTAVTPDLCAGYWSIYVSSVINDTIHLVIDL